MKFKKSNQTIITLFSIVILFGSCNSHKTYKIDNLNAIANEYKTDAKGTVNKYVNHTVELTGTFKRMNDKFNDTSRWIFVCLDSNGAEAGANSMSGIVNSTSQITVNTDMDNKAVSSNSIVAAINKPTVNTDYWIFNKEKNEVLNLHTWVYGDQDDFFKIFDTKKEEIYYLNQNTTEPLKDTTIRLLDKHIMYYLRDTNLISAIRQNGICYSKFNEGQNLLVIDKVTIQGTVKDLSYAQQQNNDAFGQYNMLTLSLTDVKIINKERNVELNKLPVLDYLSKQKIIESSLQSVPKDTIQKVQPDTIKRG